MRKNVTAESIQTKFCTSTPWMDIVTYLIRHQIGPRVWEGWQCEPRLALYRFRFTVNLGIAE